MDNPAHSIAVKPGIQPHIRLLQPQTSVQTADRFLKQRAGDLEQIILKTLRRSADRIFIEDLIFAHHGQQLFHVLMPVVKGDIAGQINKPFLIINPVQQFVFILEVIIERLTIESALFRDIPHRNLVKVLVMA